MSKTDLVQKGPVQKESCWTSKWSLGSIHINNEVNINMNIDIDMKIDIHIIINMHIVMEYYMGYYTLRMPTF